MSLLWCTDALLPSCESASISRWFCLQLLLLSCIFIVVLSAASLYAVSDVHVDENAD